MNKKLWVIVTTSLVTKQPIYFRIIRGRKCRWSEDINRAYAFSSKESAEHCIKMKQLKYVQIKSIKRNTEIIDNETVNKSHPMAPIFNLWNKI